MKRPLNLMLYAMLILLSAASFAQAQTEGFNVKTPVQQTSDNASSLLNGIIGDAKNDPEHSIPNGLICEADCYLVVPSVAPVPGRDDFAGTGLLTCRTAGSGKLTPPIIYQITNLESFDESGGGILILVTDRAGVKSVLGDQLQLSSANTGAGKVGASADSAGLKSFVAYAKPSGDVLEGFDPSGSTLVYGSGDTFNAYQQDIDPVDVMLFTIDVPPALRGFASSVEELRKGCK